MATPNQYPDRNRYPDRNPTPSPEYNSSNYPDSTSNHPDSYSDRQTPLDDQTIHTRPATSDEIAYREGYTFGRNQEQLHERIAQKQRNDNTAAGVAIGVLLATLAGMVWAMTYFGSRSQQIEQTPVPVPTQTQSSPTPTPNPERTTIIERQPQIVPVPQNEIIIPNTNPSNSGQSNTVQPNLTQPNTQPSTIQPSQTQPDTNSAQPNSTDPTLTQPDRSGESPSQTIPDPSTNSGSTQY